MSIKLEICAGSLTSAINARLGGAHRIELCANLSEGGTTPSPGIIKQTLKFLNIPVHVLIRPRSGDFLYSESEFEAMKEDVLFCKVHGAKGIVAGIQQNDGSVDTDRMEVLVNMARPMQVTFHRAFDMTCDPFQAMEDIIGLGIDRILTSGQAATAWDGVPLISQLIRKADGRIIIMPGGGITENNVADILKLTGASEVHASLKARVVSIMASYKPTIKMGDAPIDEYSWFETDADKVRQFMQVLNRNFQT